MDPGTFGDGWQRVEEEANLMPFFSVRYEVGTIY